MTCSNVTLALLFQRQGEEKLGPSFLFNCHELQDKQFPRLSFLLRKPRFRNRPPDGQSVNDSIFHYHWNVSQLRLNPPFQDSSKSHTEIPRYNPDIYTRCIIHPIVKSWRIRKERTWHAPHSVSIRDPSPKSKCTCALARSHTWRACTHR